MKNIKHLIATVVFSLSLSMTVFAGDIQGPTAQAPSTGSLAPTCGEVQCPEVTESEELSLGETLLLQLLLTIF